MTYFDMSQLSRGASAIGCMVQEHEERVAALEHDLIAALARAEAAEAERDELRERHDNLKNAYANLVEEAAERLVRRLVRMYAAERRVAELEAQLAAQGWRPVTITEPSPDFTVELLIVGYRGHDGYWHYPDGPEGLVIRGWRPAPQEPTQ